MFGVVSVGVIASCVSRSNSCLNSFNFNCVFEFMFELEVWFEFSWSA